MGNQLILKAGVHACTGGKLPLSECGPAWQLGIIAELHHIDEALKAAAMGPLPADVLRRLDKLYESDFGRV